MSSLIKPSRWTPTNKDQIDPDADVILAFHGLMCMCNNEGGFCEVGIVNTDDDHKLGIYLFEVDPVFDPPASIELGNYTLIDSYDVSNTGDAYTDIVSFDVFRSRISGVTFFLPPSYPPKQDPNDFRFILDLEGPDFYDGIELGKNYEALGPRLHISDAVFYTLFKTPSTFTAKEGSSTGHDIHGLATMIGANIYLDNTPSSPGKVYLTIANSPAITLPTKAGKKNLVIIDNSCPSCATANPPVSDFPIYYDAVKVPVGRKKFTLQKSPGGSGAAGRAYGHQFMSDLNRSVPGSPIKIDVNDETPCAVAGNGSSGSLGPP
jgi:hypothetical protein